MPQVSDSAKCDVVKIKNNGWLAVPCNADSGLPTVTAPSFDACRAEVLKYGAIADYVFSEKLVQIGQANG